MDIDLLGQVEQISEIHGDIKKQIEETTEELEVKILKAYEGGVVMPLLARATGLTVGRISQIIKKRRAMAQEEASTSDGS